MGMISKIRGSKKSKKDQWIESPSRKWHRIDPTNGRQTACNVPINTTTWGFPQDEPPAEVQYPHSKALCKMPECRGTTPKPEVP